MTAEHRTISNRDALLASWNGVSGNLSRPPLRVTKDRRGVERPTGTDGTVGRRRLKVSESADPLNAQLASVDIGSPDYFSGLGVRPSLGRLLVPGAWRIMVHIRSFYEI